jgi:hypothetical protein
MPECESNQRSCGGISDDKKSLFCVDQDDSCPVTDFTLLLNIGVVTVGI